MGKNGGFIKLANLFRNIIFFAGRIYLRTNMVVGSGLVSLNLFKAAIADYKLYCLLYKLF